MAIPENKAYHHQLHADHIGWDTDAPQLEYRILQVEITGGAPGANATSKSHKGSFYGRNIICFHAQ